MMMNDFLDTAQIISEMDLIITVSTSISVIAAAMGKPTWVLLDDLPFWLWGLQENTPWFHNVKLYRQQQTGDWTTVVKQVQADLLNNSY
jgi:ADP-heptose:LPS heptosyltransferase